LDKLIVYLADNIWSLFTASNISKYLKSQKIDLNTNVVLNYLNYISSVYLVNKVKRQEIVWKKIFEINDKFYFSDLWIRNAIIGWYKQVDIAKIIENIVFIHFKSLWYSVFIWKNKNKEIDFIVEKWKDKKYIQVTYLLSEELTIKREFWNLLEIPDNYEKIVLSMDKFVDWDYKGIKHYNIIDYLKKI
jgi:predicted AAA+ superfamily ATPase